MVLLAVGDIQDDAKRDFIQVAEDAGSDCLIVDAPDVARLFIAYQHICPNDGRAYSSGKCPRCGRTADTPIELTINVHEDLRWETLSLKDVSHNQARRYRADILTNPYYSKAVLREVIKVATWELRQSGYARSELVEARFGDQSADCVFLFVYVDLQDVQRTNWVCRTQWITSDLAANWKPLPLKGTEWLGDIEIDWSNSYHVPPRSTSRATKQAWTQRVGDSYKRASVHVQQIEILLDDLGQGELGEVEFQQQMSELEPAISDLVGGAMGTKLPPFEVETCDQIFNGMIGYLHNTVIPYPSWSHLRGDHEHQIRVTRIALASYAEDEQRFLYEWKKVR